MARMTKADWERRSVELQERAAQAIEEELDSKTTLLFEVFESWEKMSRRSKWTLSNLAMHLAWQDRSISELQEEED